MLETFTKKAMIRCQLELEKVSGKGREPRRLMLLSRRESMMIELTKTCDHSLMDRWSTSEHGMSGFDSQHDQLFLV